MIARHVLPSFSDLIGDDVSPHASAFTLFETRVVLSSKGGPTKLRAFDEWLRLAKVTAVDFDEEQSALAIDAYRRFGKGNHPAGPNLGDCFASALAKSLDAPLLFKGNDFSRTDIRPAL